MRIVLALVLAIPLAGCMTDQERMARNDTVDDQTCRGYGAKPGSDVYVQCRVAQTQQRGAADNAAAIAAAASGPVTVNNVSSSPPSYPTLQPIINPGPRCTSRGC
jgi:hypothetical protein